MRKSGWVAVAVVLVLAVGAALLVRSALRPDHQASVGCAGDTGDTGRIQSAIDDSGPGDEVVLDGPCVVDETIVLRGGRAYRGQSPSTELRAAPGSNLPAVLASDSWVKNTRTTGDPISLRDLTVDGNAEANPGGGDAIVLRSWNSQVEDLHILDSPGSCLRLTSTSSDGTEISEGNTQVNGTIRGLFAFRCGVHGIFVEDPVNAVTDWNLVDNWVGETEEDGIRLENAAGWTIRANHVFAAKGSGIDAFRLFATSIADNYVEDFGTGSGIAAFVQGDEASTIHDNRIFQNADRQDGTMLAVTGGASGTGNLSVTGNVIVGNGTGVGLSYQSQGQTLRVTSSGNNVSGVTTPLTGVSPVGDY